MEIELPDGTILDAPDDADPSVVAKNYMAKQGQPAAPAPDEGVGRQVALTGRAVGEGVLGGLAGLAEEFTKLGTGGKVMDSMLIEHTGKNKMQHDIANFNRQFGTKLPEAGSLPELLSALLTKAGAPEPESDNERLAYAGVSGASNALATGGGAAPKVITALSGAAGGTASEKVRQEGGGKAAQLAAGVLAGLTPGAIKAAAAEGTKAILRGGATREQVRSNIDTFQRSGATATAGQATESRLARGTESLLSRAPGGSGVMARTAQQQADDIGAGIERSAASLAPKSSAEQAGRAITAGVSGEKGFTETFRARQGELYNKLDETISPGATVDVSNTRKALAALNEEIKGAPELSRFFTNSKIKDIEGALAADAGTVRDSLMLPTNGKLPYEALKKLRTLVGNEMSDSWAGSDVSRSKWNSLYGALSRDLEGAARQSGPKATAAWTRANNFTRAGMRRMETIQTVLDRNGGPESVFKAATSGNKEGATTLRAVMQSLPKDAQKTVSATVLRRLGRARAGVQDDLGEAFSTETFLTNWNSMSKEAKAVLFDRYGASFRQNMDEVAKVASNLRTGSQVFRNPSGTAQASIQYGTVGAFAMAAMTGNAGTAGAIAAGVGASNVAARLMTHPPFVSWLAKATRVPMEGLPPMLVQLSKSDDPLLQEAAGLLEAGQNVEQDGDRNSRQ